MNLTLKVEWSTKSFSFFNPLEFQKQRLRQLTSNYIFSAIIIKLHNLVTMESIYILGLVIVKI